MLVPLLGLDGGATLAQEMDDLGVLEGKRGHGDLDLLDGLILEAKVRHLVKTLLHLVLDPGLETLDSGEEESAL